MRNLKGDNGLVFLHFFGIKIIEVEVATTKRGQLRVKASIAKEFESALKLKQIAGTKRLGVG